MRFRADREKKMMKKIVRMNSSEEGKILFRTMFKSFFKNCILLEKLSTYVDGRADIEETSG